MFIGGVEVCDYNPYDFLSLIIRRVAEAFFSVANGDSQELC